MMMSYLIAGAAALFLQSTAPGWDAFRDGDYETAVKLGVEAGTADGYALACRSKTVLGGYMASGAAAIDHLHDALKLCETSITLDGTHLIGRMTYAMVAGFEGKRLFSPGYASQARRHMEYLASIYPDNPMAVAAVGGWHSEVHAAGFLARTALGGSKSKARAYYARALALGTVDMALQVEYVKFLTREGKDRWGEAAAVLDDVIDRDAETHFEGILQGLAAKIRTALETGSKRAVRAAVKSAGAFQAIEDQKRARPAYKLQVDAPDTDDYGIR